MSDPAQARWLVACQWPDQPDRIHRARTAIALAHTEQPELIAGDAVADVGDLVVRVAQFALPVVVSTWVLSYLDDERRRAFIAELDRLATDRDLTFVFAEQPILVAGLPLPARPDGRPDGPETALVRVDWRHGGRTVADRADHGNQAEQHRRTDQPAGERAHHRLPTLAEKMTSKVGDMVSRLSAKP